MSLVVITKKRCRPVPIWVLLFYTETHMVSNQRIQSRGVQWLLDEMGLLLKDFKPRYNISPSALIHTIYLDKGQPTVIPMTWGSLPPWAKLEVKPLINAKSETIREKPSLKHLIKKQRAVIPVNGFHEWNREGKIKQAFYITPSDGFNRNLWKSQRKRNCSAVWRPVRR